jgi:hypothetical protein
MRLRRDAWLAGVLLLLTGARVTGAQQLGATPEYFPLNPTIAARSSLSAFPFLTPHAGWRVTWSLEYGSAVELDAGQDAAYVLDAELYRSELAATRAVGASGFVLLQGGIMGAHAGFGDAFFDWFHERIRHRQWARDNRPRNVFAYEVALPTGERVDARPVRLALTDVRAGVGRRHGRHLQSVLTVTLPLATAPTPYRRGAPSLALVNSLRVPIHDRLTYEASLGAGYTPAAGVLAAAQRSAAYSASSGLRIRVWREHAVYGSLFYHSPTYRAVGLPELTGGELSVAFGAMFVGGRGRQWHVGLVEETRTTDASIDLILKLGTSW